MGSSKSLPLLFSLLARIKNLEKGEQPELVAMASNSGTPLMFGSLNMFHKNLGFYTTHLLLLKSFLTKGENTMSINANLQQFGKSILKIPQQVINFVLGGFKKIFSPSDDKYPAVGVQPFEGDRAEEE